jgi:hypothetical protein
MKYLFMFIVAAVLTAPLSAQTKTDKARLESLRQEAEVTRRDTLAKELGLNEAETAKFWPIYQNYRKDILEINRESANLIIEVIDNYTDIADKRAQQINERMLYLDDKKLSLRDDYIGRFSKIMAPRKVTKFYVIERTLDSRLTAKIVDALRTVEPLSTTY